MALGTNPTLIQIRNEFGGGGNLRAYARNGGLVPNTSANQNITTDANLLRQTMFSGASAVTLPPAPYFPGWSAYDAWQNGSGSANAYIVTRNNGQVWINDNGGWYRAVDTWLPGGRSASEYLIRTAWGPNGESAGGWTNMGSGDYTLAAASAWTDGFYSDSQSETRWTQIAATNGQALTGWVASYASADANGRG